MRHRNYLTMFALLLFMRTQKTQAQTPPGIELIHFRSSHTAFPDTGRMAGHSYNGVFYDASSHYSDDSVLLIVPDHLRATRKLDMVFWFHGWRNNIDSAAIRYGLIRQFAAAGRNAVLVLAETARDAPDSYGGKLEQEGMFLKLVNDVLAKLHSAEALPGNCRPGNIILAGHSGAYRVIAAVLAKGEVRVRETDLFDALYGQTESFMNWLETDRHNRFINWYTNVGGGTDLVSKSMMQQMKTSKLSFVFTQEDSLSIKMLQNNKRVFVHSNRPHDAIINDPDNFEWLLESSPFLRKLRN